jgi:hypothetical protein
VRQVRWLGVALTVGAIGFAGCGGDSEGETTVGASGDPILIRTRVNIPTGVVLNESSIGDSPFCSGGTLRDEGGDDTWLMYRTIRCPNGTLRIGFYHGHGGSRPAHGRSLAAPAPSRGCRDPVRWRSRSSPAKTRKVRRPSPGRSPNSEAFV